MKRILGMAAFSLGMIASSVSITQAGHSEMFTTYTCAETVACLEEASCGGISWSRVGSCGLQCWKNGEEEGEIVAGAFIQCAPEFEG